MYIIGLLGLFMYRIGLQTKIGLPDLFITVLGFQACLRTG